MGKHLVHVECAPPLARPDRALGKALALGTAHRELPAVPGSVEQLHHDRVADRDGTACDELVERMANYRVTARRKPRTGVCELGHSGAGNRRCSRERMLPTEAREPAVVAIGGHPLAA